MCLDLTENPQARFGKMCIANVSTNVHRAGLKQKHYKPMPRVSNSLQYLLHSGVKFSLKGKEFLELLFACKSWKCDRNIPEGVTHASCPVSPKQVPE